MTYVDADQGRPGAQTFQLTELPSKAVQAEFCPQRSVRHLRKMAALAASFGAHSTEELPGHILDRRGHIQKWGATDLNCKWPRPSAPITAPTPAVTRKVKGTHYCKKVVKRPSFVHGGALERG